MLEKDQILTAAKKWFKDDVITSHVRNTESLTNIKKLVVNPFTAIYLANFLSGDTSPESIAKALLYPRVLGTSISTSFGERMQKFIGVVKDAYGSTTSGIDIEFEDKVDGLHKYCQLKAGPTNINKDGAENIISHFKAAMRLANTNNNNLTHYNFMVGVLYGKPHELNGFFKSIPKKELFQVCVGNDFWNRLTGDKDFYDDLIEAIASVSVDDTNYCSVLEDVIASLAKSEEIQLLSQSVSEIQQEN